MWNWIHIHSWKEVIDEGDRTKQQDGQKQKTWPLQRRCLFETG